jgi:hypothetical protein
MKFEELLVPMSSHMEEIWKELDKQTVTSTLVHNIVTISSEHSKEELW